MSPLGTPPASVPNNCSSLHQRLRHWRYGRLFHPRRRHHRLRLRLLWRLRSPFGGPRQQETLSHLRRSLRPPKRGARGAKAEQGIYPVIEVWSNAIKVIMALQFAVRCDHFLLSAASRVSDVDRDAARRSRTARAQQLSARRPSRRRAAQPDHHQHPDADPPASPEPARGADGDQTVREMDARSNPDRPP